MSYSKRDFLHWDEDINLDDLLGEYTHSECEDISDDDMVSESMSQKPQSRTLYKCSECESGFASVAGIRGHLQKKHGKSRVRVADYRVKQLTGNDKSKEEPLKVNKTSFSEIFHLVFDKSVNNVHQSQFRRLSFSIHGKGIVQICEILLENSSLKAQLSSILELAFLAVLNSKAADGCSLKETLFSKFYEMTLQSANEIIIALKDKIDPVLPLRQFAGVLLRQVMEDIIDERSSVYKKDIEKAQNEISEADQSVLFYISGYIIHAVENSQKRLKHSSQSMQDAISLLLKNEHDSKKTFIEKYSKWTERVNRGGLKIPSDNFFLLIREFEFVCRKSVGEEALNSYTFCKTNVKNISWKNLWLSTTWGN